MTLTPELHWRGCHAGVVVDAVAADRAGAGQGDAVPAKNFVVRDRDAFALDAHVFILRVEELIA